MKGVVALSGDGAADAENEYADEAFTVQSTGRPRR